MIRKLALIIVTCFVITNCKTVKKTGGNDVADNHVPANTQNESKVYISKVNINSEQGKYKLHYLPDDYGTDDACSKKNSQHLVELTYKDNKKNSEEDNPHSKREKKFLDEMTKMQRAARMYNKAGSRAINSAGVSIPLPGDR